MPRGGDERLSQTWFWAGNLGCKPCIPVWTMSSAWVRGTPQPSDKQTPCFDQELEYFHCNEMESPMSQGAGGWEREGGRGGEREGEFLWPYAQCGAALRPAFSLLPPPPMPGTYFLSCFLANYYSASIFQFKCPCLDPLNQVLSIIAPCTVPTQKLGIIWKYLYLRVYLFNVCPC